MRWLGLSLALALPCAAAACYSTGDGTSPPPNQLYFPVGLAVSHGGNVLYVANSDFDLQWNGGTLQSYDLHLIRKHTAMIIADPKSLPDWVTRPNPGDAVDCNSPDQVPPVYKTDNSGQRQPLGETCAPPVDSSRYVRDSVTIGAFATDLQLAVPRPFCVPDVSPGTGARCDDVLRCADGNHCELSPGADRLFSPVRGDGSLTWASVALDDPAAAPPEDGSVPYAPFGINCGTRSNGRCDAYHQAGTNPLEPGNTRNITLPGEPFGMAQSPIGDAIAVTHQTDTKTSLFSTGMSGATPEGNSPYPSLQYVLDGVTNGGNGIFAVPHDAQAFDRGTEPPNPAFLLTSNQAAEVDLLRYYPDGCSGCGPNLGSGPSSTLARPFLVKEAVFPLTASAGGTDSRGVLVDPSPRIQCKASVKPAGAGRTQADVDADIQSCARVPARVFIANRSPAAMLMGEIGETSTSGDGTYNADQLVVFGTIPLSVGVSRLYLAPIVDASGNYALRVFIVCFDSATLYVFDPENGVIENVIRTAPGPFAMAFDPFDFRAAALHQPVLDDPREPTLGLKNYRFAYIASFTNSYIQVIDLDNSRPTNGARPTYENVVFTLGQPTLPKGTQ